MKDGTAPEKPKTYKSDIYSLGYILNYLSLRPLPNLEFSENVIEMCLRKDPTPRLKILELIKYFLVFYNIQDKITNVDKGIHYFSLAADQNNSDALFGLGVVYYTGQYISCNINKANKNFSLAADQNNSKAKYNLGVIYYEGKYISCDIDKAIHYFSLVANYYDSNALYNLGVIYAEGKYISRDIDKAIYFYS